MNSDKPLALIYFISIPISLAAILSAVMASSDPNQSQHLGFLRLMILMGWMAGPVILFMSASRLTSGCPKKLKILNMEMSDHNFPIFYLVAIILSTFIIGVIGEFI